MASVPSWEDFVNENLLSSNLFCGVCLLSQLGEIVYTYGQLTNISQDETRQFLRAFQTTSEKAEQQIMEGGFSLACQWDRKMQFKIYTKTFCGIYCTSKDNSMGLTVSKLPYGVLVCLYTYPVSATKAVKQVELFCDKLRL